MDLITLDALRNISTVGAPAYAAQARDLITGAIHWSDEDVALFLDSFNNDPHLFRNTASTS